MIRTLLSVAALGFWGLPAVAQEAVSSSEAVLRGLDKVSGEVVDIELSVGEIHRYGLLAIRMDDCRFPAGNPSGDAWAFLVIEDTRTRARVFEGWMIASAPALNALDHARYDIWVLRCKTS